MRMKETPPGMKNNMPKRPGESKTDYLGRVRDMKAAGVKPTTSGRTGNDIMVRPGTKPTPRTMGGAASKMGPGPVKTGAPVMRAKGGMVKGKKK